MIKLKDGYAKLIGTTATGSANNVLLSNGGDKITGNASGNIPLNNGTLNVDLNADKLDGYDSSDFFRHEGSWSSTDDTKNVNSATGMLFVYKKHGVPELYGTIATFRGKPQPNYYNLQLYGSALNKLFFRNWSPDLGLKDWVEVLSTGNYTKYLGYIGTTAVQATSAVQDLTGIKNIDITANSSDRFITFKTTTTHFWRIGYLGSGTANNNLLVFQSTKSGSETDGYYNALTFGCETLQATFSGNILVDRSVPIIQAKGTNGSVSLLVDSNRGIYDHVTNKWALGITAANNTYLNVGNVGIGTASPSEKLHVAGKVLATHFVKSGATNALILLGNGSNTGTGVKGNLLYYTAGVPGWTTTRYFSITLDDNSGKPVYLLISDVTAQLNATSSAPVGEYGIVGTFYGYRGGNMAGTSVIDIVAYAAYSKGNVRLRSSTGEFITPYIVKYLEKYYIALKKKGSGRPHYFHGLAFNLLDSFISVPCTDAQGTCPDIEIIREPESWTTITSTKISDYTNTYDILHSGNFKNVIGNGSYWKVNDKTYNVTSNGSISSEDMYLEMWRGTNSSWRITNTGGRLKFQNNYTTKVGNYFDVLSLDYYNGDATLKGNLNINGDATLKGKLNIKGEGLYLNSSGTYPRFRVVSSGNAIYIQAGKGDGSALEGSLYITGHNTVPLTRLDLKATVVNIPGRVVIKNANAPDALDVFTTYNAHTYLRLGRDYGKNNCSEFLYEYAGLNSNNNNLRIGFYNNSTSLLRGYAGGNWLLNNNLSISKEFNANDKHFNYALAYNEIPGFNVGGMVVITLPNTWNAAMNLYEIDIYDYVGGTKADDAQHSKLTIGVYNYTDTNYFSYGYTQLGSFNRKVRLAHDGTHCCILLGEPTSTWNYTLVFLSRVLAGHSEYRTWSSGYSINLVTSETAYTKITELHRTRLRFDDVVADNFRGNLIGNADTASKWKTARTLTVGNAAKTVDGSADVTWDLESILKNPTTIGTTSSWDITVPGVYGVASVNKFSGTNNPEHHAVSGEVYRYGLLIVSRSGHGLALFYISHRDSDVSKYGIKYRTGYNSTYVSEWARLLDTLNYEKYVVKLDGHSLLWNNLYYTYKEVTMDTPDTVWYVKIVLSAYAQPNLIMINTGYNNRVDRAFLQFTGLSLGYFYRNNCQNQGNLTGICLKTGYDSVEKKWIFWLRFRPISSTAAEGPATSATCKVYLGQSNNAFDISATTTAPEGVTWETVGTTYTGLLLRYATVRGNLIGNSDSATKAYLTYNNTSTAEYPIIWSNSNNTTSLNGSLFKSYSDLTYSPSNKRLTVKGLVTSPLFFHNLTSASSNPIIYIGSNNLNTTLLRVYSSDAADTSTFTGRYGYSLKYLGSDSNNRLALMADNSAATTLNVAIAFTNTGNVGIRDYANSDFSLHVSGKTNILTSNFGALWIRRLSSNLGAAIGFHNTLGTLGYLGMKDVNGGILRWSADTNSMYKVWDEANDGPGSGLNADLLDGYQETDFFRSRRGDISTDYVDIDVFSNGDSRFKVVDPGTYSINRSTHSELFINFKGAGSTSGLEFKTNYDNNARLCIRKTVDSKRISGVWKELAFYDDIADKLNGYYWANVKISSTSSKYTLPTFLNLFIDTYDATLKIYSGRIADAKSDGNICFLTCIDLLDGQSHSYASSTYASRLNLVLLPRAGQVYIGVNPEVGNTNYKLYVNGAIYGTRFAGPADKLTTARTIALGEAVQSTATAFDGSANISIPVTGLKESYLIWGGKNLSDAFGPLDAAMVGMFGANRFDLMDPSKIIVEYSRDGGSTWLDYGADSINKINLVSQTVTNSPFVSGKSNTTDRPTANCRLRVIINTASSVYTRLKKFYIYLTTEYASACKCTVSGRLQLDYENNVNNWTVFVDNASIGGWSGWNVLNADFTTYGNNKATLYGQIKFEFSCGSISSSISSSAKGLTIYKIFGVGGVGWATPSFMSLYNHLYKYNAEKKATFPGIVEATGFLKTGSSDSYLLLGGGGHKAISNFYWADIPITTSATTNKKPTLSGIIFSGGSESFDSWGNFKLGASSASWNVFKNDGTTSLMKISASSGNMTVLGSVTAPTFIGNLNGDITKKTPYLCSATESDNINIVENSNGAITNNYISNLSAIRKAIQFRWYSTYWQIGNIRGASSGTDGFGITYGSNTLCFRVTETASYVYGNMYAVHFYESSDKRLKTNIQEILNSDKMPTIKEFDWKEDGSHSYGLIAQELEEQGYSELVSTKDNGYKTVNYSAALSLIVGKLQVKIKELEKEIENLRNKN